MPVRLLCERLTQLYQKYLHDKMVIIIVDFNVGWNAGNCDKNDLQNLLVNSFKYRQVINEPTNDHGSTRDLIFTNNENLDSGVCETYYSDHKIVKIAR